MNFVGEATPKTSSKRRKSSVAGPPDEQLGAVAGEPAEEPARRDARAVEERAEGDLVGGDLERAMRREAAAVLPGAAGIGGEAVLDRAQRVAVLEDLDRRVAAVRVTRDLGVVAVLQCRPARPHAVEVVVRVVGAGLGMDAAEEEVRARAAARGGDAVGNRLGEARRAAGRSASAAGRCCRRPTGPGWRTFTTLPGGAMIRIGR